MSQETWVEVQIRRAMEEGKFDNLPGAGKPLRNLHKTNDPLWWAREKARAEGLDTSAMLPPSLRLRKEKQRLHDAIADLPSEKAVWETVEDLNEQIKEHWRAPSGPSVPVALMDLDEALERWRTARRARDAAASDSTADTSAGDREGTRTGWWRRIIGRGRA